MDVYRIFALLGILGPIFCMGGDLLLDLKGPDNVKSGKYGLLDSAWVHMDVRRFRWSILLAGVGTPLAAFGFVAMAHELARARPGFGLAYFVISLIGVAGGFFIHTFICLLPILWKKGSADHGPAYGEALVNTAYEAVRLPFWALYLALVILPCLLAMFALWNGYLCLSRWWLLATLPVLMLGSGVLRKLFPRACCDLPLVVTPSLSLALLSLMALLNMG